MHTLYTSSSLSSCRTSMITGRQTGRQATHKLIAGRQTERWIHAHYTSSSCKIAIIYNRQATKMHTLYTSSSSSSSSYYKTAMVTYRQLKIDNRQTTNRKLITHTVPIIIIIIIMWNNSMIPGRQPESRWEICKSIQQQRQLVLCSHMHHHV